MRRGAFEQRRHGRVDVPMPRRVEVVRLEERQHIGDRQPVLEHRAEHRLLGLAAVRRNRRSLRRPRQVRARCREKSRSMAVERRSCGVPPSSTDPQLVGRARGSRPDLADRSAGVPVATDSLAAAAAPRVPVALPRCRATSPARELPGGGWPVRSTNASFGLVRARVDAPATPAARAQSCADRPARCGPLAALVSRA